MSKLVDAYIVSPDTAYKSLYLENEKLKKALEIAKEKLGFYADINNCSVCQNTHTDFESFPTMSGGLYMTGKRARQALKEIEEVLR